VSGGLLLSSYALPSNKPTTSQEFITLGEHVHSVALLLRERHMEKLTALNAQSKAAVGVVREDAIVLNAQNAILHDERLAAASKLRILCLVLIKKGSLALLIEAEVLAILSQTEKAADLILKGMEDSVEPAKCRESLRQGMELTAHVASRLLSPVEEESDGRNQLAVATNIMQWELTDTEFLELQLIVETELETDEERAKMSHEEMLTTTSFVEAESVIEIAKRGRQGCCAVTTRRLADRLVPGFVRLYPRFYFVFFAGFVASFLQFALQIGATSNTALKTTFLPVPAYYNLTQFSEQRVAVPLLYAFMHAALYCFCWLPLPFARGLWRDVSRLDPKFRKHLPIDDVFFFHKLLGVLTLICIFVGAGIYLVVLSVTCYGLNHTPSCKGFDVQPKDGIRSLSFTYNPFENVLALRKAVWLLWFPILPLLHWAQTPPPSYVYRL